MRANYLVCYLVSETYFTQPLSLLCQVFDALAHGVIAHFLLAFANAEDEAASAPRLLNKS